MISDRDFSAGAAWVEGQYVPIAEARIPIMDWGFLHSDATYDVVHVWAGRFFRLDNHIARFRRSIDKLAMKLPVSGAELRTILHECVALTALENAYVEMICTRGVPQPGSRDPRLARNALFAFAIPFMWIADPAAQEQGIALRISSVMRIPPASVDPTVKNYHWHDLTRGILEAYAHGDDTPVLVDDKDHITEGPGFNIFLVRNARLITPDSGILEGITRRTAIELARTLERRVDERPIPAIELPQANEIFITSTAGGIMPVTRVDGKPVADGRPGPVTTELKRRYWNAHGDPKWSEPVLARPNAANR